MWHLHHADQKPIVLKEEKIRNINSYQKYVPDLKKC